ncbi:MAG: hypothetical protein JSS02_27880, partial [Planctomycetes bacterium]|nr:hypothetical protein [Planctomycetota bacterium]
MTTETTEPVPSETPAATSGEPASPAETAAATPAAPSADVTPAGDAASAPRVQLNPTINPEQAKAIPTIREEAVSAPAGENAEAEISGDAGADRGASATFVPPQEKVEVPSKRTSQ